MSRRYSLFLDRFEVKRQLGEGSYGIVVLAHDHKTLNQVKKSFFCFIKTAFKLFNR